MSAPVPANPLSDTGVSFSSDAFFARVTTLIETWTERFANDFDALVLLDGKDEEGAIKIKTNAMHFWFFEIELTDTLIVFTKKSVVLLFGQKKLDLINHYIKRFENSDYNLVFLVKDSTSNTHNFQKLFEIIRTDTGVPAKWKLGGLPNEKQLGPFVSECEEYIKLQECSIVDARYFYQELYIIKANTDLDYVRKSAKAACFFETKLLTEVEKIIDEELKLSHSAISSKIEALVNNPATTHTLERKYNINKNFFDIPYAPIIQSGGTYDLRPNAESNENILEYDTIVCMCGGKYFNYNTNIVRTLFIDPTNDQKQNYLNILELRNIILQNLKPGNKLSQVHQKGVEFLKEKAPILLEKISQSMGFGIGLEFKESNLLINAKNNREIKKNMVFNVALAFNELKNEKSKSYAIMVADTVIITAEGNEVATNQISVKYEDVSYSLEEVAEAEERKVQAPVKDQKTKPSNNNGVNLKDFQSIDYKKKTRGPKKKDEEQEIKRKEHQKSLLRLKQEELEDRLKSGSFSLTQKKAKNFELAKVRAYNSLAELPKDLKPNQIYVDFKHSSIILPIQGKHIPFHISVLKNISKHDEGNNASLRLNFHVPCAASLSANINFPESKDIQNFLYIRELTFRSKDSKKMNETCKKIKDLQKRTKTELDSNKENLSEQENLILLKGKRPQLQDLKIRPNISGKKSSGMLEAHVNGFRYVTTKNERIDITFNNIKNAFFQPCDGEMIILLHFHLYTPIMVGKNKSNDVQFFTEAGTQTEDLDTRRKNYRNDMDEIEQEEREKAQRKKLNLEFEQFVKTIEQMTKEKITFDIPYRDLGFHGTPYRSNVFLQPTLHCLVNLTEKPFFIMNLADVEIANFERIQYGLKNFDLNFVFKDYDKPVIRISAIPIDSLEPIKYWLDKFDILYSESKINLNWNEVMREVKNDLEKFVDEGGWAFLQDDLSEENNDEEISNEDSEFVASSQEEAEEESEYSSDDAEEEDEEEEDEEEEEEFEDEELEDEDEESEEEPRKKTGKPSHNNNR